MKGLICSLVLVLGCILSASPIMINSFVFAPAGPPPAPPEDPYYDFVVASFHGDGADGATSITDSSKYTRSMSYGGNGTNARLSTTVPKFGSASMQFSGGYWAAAAISSDWAFGFGDFTVEYWVKTTATQSNFLGCVTNGNGWNVILYAGSLYWQTAHASANLYNVSAASIRDGGWHHVAHARRGWTHKMFFDGVQVYTGTDQTNYNVSATFMLGYSPTYGGMTGSLDDVRITKGVARYTANFTPPTSAHPDTRDDTTWYNQVGLVYKAYNVASATVPSGTVDGDVLFFQRIDVNNSVAASFSFVDQYSTTSGSSYTGDWWRVASGLGATVSMPQFSFGPLYSLRRNTPATFTVLDHHHQRVTSTTSVTVPALSGAGTLFLIVQGVKNTTNVIDHPAGWNRLSYEAQWQGGNFGNMYLLTKVNDGNSTTITANTTCEIVTSVYLVP